MLGVEEVGRAEVPVAGLVAGVDRGHGDLDLDGGLERVLGDVDGAADLGEAALGLGHHQVADAEAHVAVGRVEGVGAGGRHLGAVDDAGDGGGLGGGHWGLLVVARTMFACASTVPTDPCARNRLRYDRSPWPVPEPLLEHPLLTTGGLFVEAHAGHRRPRRAAARGRERPVDAVVRGADPPGPLPGPAPAHDRPRRPDHPHPPAGSPAPSTASRRPAWWRGRRAPPIGAAPTPCSPPRASARILKAVPVHVAHLEEVLRQRRSPPRSSNPHRRCCGASATPPTPAPPRPATPEGLGRRRLDGRLRSALGAAAPRRGCR